MVQQGGHMTEYGLYRVADTQTQYFILEHKRVIVHSIQEREAQNLIFHALLVVAYLLVDYCLFSYIRASFYLLKKHSLLF